MAQCNRSGVVTGASTVAQNPAVEKTGNQAFLVITMHAGKGKLNSPSLPY